MTKQSIYYSRTDNTKNIPCSHAYSLRKSRENDMHTNNRPRWTSVLVSYEWIKSSMEKCPTYHSL